MKLGSKFASLVTGAAMMVGAALPAAAADGQVRFLDISGRNDTFVQAAPVAASTEGRFSIIVFSDQDHVLRAAYIVAQGIEDKQSKEVTMLQASPVNGSEAKIAFYSDGIFTGNLTISNNAAETSLLHHIETAALDGLSKSVDSLDLEGN